MAIDEPAPSKHLVRGVKQQHRPVKPLAMHKTVDRLKQTLAKHHHPPPYRRDSLRKHHLRLGQTRPFYSSVAWCLSASIWLLKYTFHHRQYCVALKALILIIHSIQISYNGYRPDMEGENASVYMVNEPSLCVNMDEHHIYTSNIYQHPAKRGHNE